jgi:Tripartite tricarboxylate transporter family receptor
MSNNETPRLTFFAFRRGGCHAAGRFAARLAQAYPSRAVRIIVPFPPGGASDIIAGLTCGWLSERLGQQFVTENGPRAGSNIGTAVVVNAPPDGYTLLQVGASSAINMTLYEKLNFNFRNGCERSPLLQVAAEQSDQAGQDELSRIYPIRIKTCYIGGQSHRNRL